MDEQRICTMCREAIPDFKKNQYLCKKCRTEYVREWKKRWRPEQKLRAKETRRRWQWENREKRYKQKNERRKERIATDPEFKEKSLRSTREWARRNPEKAALSIRKVTLKRKYEISIEDYDQLLTKQNGVCAICQGTEKPMRHQSGKIVTPRLSVDHAHDSKVVRGLLCKTCNTALGRFYDDSERFQRAADYLKGTMQ